MRSNLSRRISDNTEYEGQAFSASRSPTHKKSLQLPRQSSLLTSNEVKTPRDNKSPPKPSGFISKMKDNYDKSLEENAKDRKMLQGLLKNLNGLMKDENESTKTIEKNIDTGKEDINKKIDQKYNQSKPKDKDLLNMVMFNQNEKKGLIDQFNKDRMNFITTKGGGFDYAHKNVLRKKDQI